jgi:hypothetical protein
MDGNKYEYEYDKKILSPILHMINYCESVDWFQLAQNMDQWQPHVKITEPSIPLKAGYFLTSLVTAHIGLCSMQLIN